jgi:multidrug efflux pump
MPRKVADIWYQVRKKAGDMRHELPEGVRGPFFDDEYDDVFGSIYAFTADGFSYAELKHYVDYARQEMLRLNNIKKIEMLGAQDEKIYIEMSDRQLAALGINPLPVFSLLAAQNAMEATGIAEAPEARVPLRVEGSFDSLDSIRAIGIRAANERTFSLGDVAEVWRGYEDPPTFKMRYMGQDAIGLAVSMVKGGNVLELGADLRRTMQRLQAELPIGIDIHQVTDQPRVVKWEPQQAATFAFSSTAMPMLTGTLVTVAGFLPIGLAQSAAGEYTFGIFAVVGIALLSSWIVAVLFTPYLGYTFLPQRQDSPMDGTRVKPVRPRRLGALARLRLRYQAWVIRWEEMMSDGLLRLVEWCLRHYAWVLVLFACRSGQGARIGD